LNLARAQAVRRISDKVTMKELKEQRVCEILFGMAFILWLMLIGY
jgi:hypothetical protein